MACFAVFHNATQLKVYQYKLGWTNENIKEREQQRSNAFKFAFQNHNAGYPCTVEEFGLSGVGVLVLNTVVPHLDQ